MLKWTKCLGSDTRTQCSTASHGHLRRLWGSFAPWLTIALSLGGTALSLEALAGFSVLQLLLFILVGPMAASLLSLGLISVLVR